MPKKSLIYNLISFACPIVSVTAILINQSIANADFWNSMTPEYSQAGAMMAFGEFIETALALLIGNLIGIVFACLSFWTRRQFRGLGVVALIYNCLPFAILVFLFLIRT